MAIEDLRTILLPPAAPIEAGPADWNKVEGELGTPLPADYKAYIETYGSGHVADFIWVFNPFARRDNITLQVQVERQLGVLEELVADSGWKLPYPLFPKPGGLLPLGMTDNGDVIHWHTTGQAGDWTIVVNDARSPDCVEHDTGLVGFLTMILRRDEHCAMFPASFPPAEVRFEPL